MLTIKLSVLQFALLSLTPTDADGNPAPLDGDPVFTVVEGSAEIRKLPEGTALIPGTSPGPVRIKVSGDAEQGEGVEVIEEEILLDVRAANTVALGLGFSLASKTTLPPVE